jgi:hypothetical protein
MDFDPIEFFRLSQQMTSVCNPNEAVLRTAIGRAYYSAFLLAWAKVPLDMRRKANRPAAKHWVTRWAMQKLGYPTIASKLKTLSTERGDCDYDMSTPIDKVRADEALKLADNVLQLIGRLP